MIYLLVLKEQVDAPTSLSPLISAITLALFAIGPMLWTFDEEYRIHTNPGITVALLGTLDLGPLAAVAQLLFQFGGFALGGLFVRLLAGTSAVLIDNPPNTVGLVMAWVAAFVVIFVYIYNQKFEQDGESEEDNHKRATTQYGWWLFGFALAFYTLFVLRTYNSGLYLAAGIASGNVFTGTLGGINNGLFFSLVPLFAAPATAILFYWLASWLAPNNRLIMLPSIVRSGPYTGPSPDEQESSNMEHNISSGYGMAARTTRNRRKIDTNGL